MIEEPHPLYIPASDRQIAVYIDGGSAMGVEAVLRRSAHACAAGYSFRIYEDDKADRCWSLGMQGTGTIEDLPISELFEAYHTIRRQSFSRSTPYSISPPVTVVALHQDYPYCPVEFSPAVLAMFRAHSAHEVYVIQTMNEIDLHAPFERGAHSSELLPISLYYQIVVLTQKCDLQTLERAIEQKSSRGCRSRELNPDGSVLYLTRWQWREPAYYYDNSQPEIETRASGIVGMVSKLDAKLSAKFPDCSIIVKIRAEARRGTRQCVVKLPRSLLALECACHFGVVVQFLAPED